jgi:hypothetical protein
VGSTLHVFGSSRNGFGGDTADLDMCLMVPRPGPGGGAVDWEAPPPLNRQDLVELIEAALEEAGEAAGVANLTSRATARIPLVTFAARCVRNEWEATTTQPHPPPNTTHDPTPTPQIFLCSRFIAF